MNVHPVCNCMHAYNLLQDDCVLSKRKRPGGTGECEDRAKCIVRGRDLEEPVSAKTEKNVLSRKRSGETSGYKDRAKCIKGGRDQ